MIIISKNIEDKAYQYKEWYKNMEKLIREEFSTTTDFENSLSIGQKIHFDAENPVFPDGMSFPTKSTFTIEDLRTKTLEILDISQIGNVKTIKVGIRSTQSTDSL